MTATNPVLMSPLSRSFKIRRSMSSSNNPRKFSEKIALQNQKAQEDLDRYNGILEEIREAKSSSKNSSLRDLPSTVVRETFIEDAKHGSNLGHASNAPGMYRMPGSMSGLVSVSGHTVVSPVSSGGSSGGAGSNKQAKYLCPSYPGAQTGGRTGSLPNVTAFFRQQHRHIDLQAALANLNVLTDSANRGGGGSLSSPSGVRLSRSSDGRGSRGGGGANNSSFHTGSSSNVLLQQQQQQQQQQISPNHCLGSRYSRVDTSPYGSYLLPPGGHNDNSWRRTISDSRLYESASQPRRVPVSGMPFAPGSADRGPGPAPKLSSKSKSPSARCMPACAERRKMSDDPAHILNHYHRTDAHMKANRHDYLMQHSSPSPDSSAQQSPDTGSPATPGSRQHSLTIASPPMLNTAAMNMPRAPSQFAQNALSPQDNNSLPSNNGVSSNTPGGSLPDLSSGGAVGYPSNRAQIRANIMTFNHSGASPSSANMMQMGGTGAGQQSHHSPSMQDNFLSPRGRAMGMGSGVPPMYLGGYLTDAMGNQFEDGVELVLSSSSTSSPNGLVAPSPHHAQASFNMRPSIVHHSQMLTSQHRKAVHTNSAPRQRPIALHHHQSQNQNQTHPVILPSSSVPSRGGVLTSRLSSSGGGGGYSVAEAAGLNEGMDSSSSSMVVFQDCSSYSECAFDSSVALPLNLSNSGYAMLPCSMNNPAGDKLEHNNNNNNNPSVVVTSAVPPVHMISSSGLPNGGGCDWNGQYGYHQASGQPGQPFDYSFNHNNIPNGGLHSHSHSPNPQNATSYLNSQQSPPSASQIDPLLFTSEDFPASSNNKQHQMTGMNRSPFNSNSSINNVGGATGDNGVTDVINSNSGFESLNFDDPAYMESLLNATSLSHIHQQMSYMKVSQDKETSSDCNSHSFRHQQQQQQLNSKHNTASNDILFDPSSSDDPSNNFLPSNSGGEFVQVGGHSEGVVRGHGSLQGMCSDDSSLTGFFDPMQHVGGLHESMGSSYSNDCSSTQRQIQVPDIVLTKSEEMDLGNEIVISLNTIQSSVASSMVTGGEEMIELEPLTDADLKMLEEGDFIEDQGIEESLG